MECPVCNQETVAGASFCHHCGAALPSPSQGAGRPADEPEPGPSEEPPQPAPSEGGPAPPSPAQTSEWGGAVPQAPPPIPPPEDAEGPPDRATGDLFPDAGPGAGWLRALTLGTLAWVVMVLLAVVVAVAGFLDGISLVDAAKIGGLLFFGFHHVGVSTDFPSFDPSAILGGDVPDLGLGPIDFSFTVSVALLTATLLALFLLYRAGRRAADDGGGSVGLRVAQGAAVGIPYAVLSSLLALVVGFDLPVPGEVAELFGTTGEVSVSVSPLSALLWPLGLGLLAGGLGGLGSARGMLASTGGTRLQAAASGAGRGVLLVLLLGFVGLLVLAGLSPDLTSSYLGLIGEGRGGLVLLVFTVLALANMAVLGTVLGMGGSIVVGEYLGSTEHLASLLRFPQEIQTEGLAGGIAPAVPGVAPVEFGVAPAGYFFFILVPLVATILAGRRAARRGDAALPGEGAVLGALAGVLWAAALLLLAVLAGVGMQVSMGAGGMVESQGGYLGPHLVLGGALALVWGVLGGAAGGAIGAGGGAPAPAREAPGPEARPLAGATGFEGMAAERYEAQQRAEAPPPEPAEEPEREEVPSPAEPEAPPGPEEPERAAPEEPERAAPEEPEGAEAGSGAPAGPAFQLATPATQYGASPEPKEAAPPEEPRGAEEAPPPEPPPWSPPPWERAEEDEAQRPAGTEEEPEAAPAEEPAPWAQPPPPEQGEEEGGPAEPEPWRPAPEPEAEEAPPWASRSDQEAAPEEPATPWGGPAEPEEQQPSEPREPWTAPPEPGEEEDREDRPAWMPPPEPREEERPPWMPPAEGAEGGEEGAPEGPAAGEEGEEGDKRDERDEPPTWMPPEPWSPAEEDRPRGEDGDDDARPPEGG